METLESSNGEQVKDAICKNCGNRQGWHIIPKLNCPYHFQTGHSSAGYHTNQFFEAAPEQTPLEHAINKAEYFHDPCKT